METLADRAWRLTAHHVRPALPFTTLVHLLRQEGCPVTAGVLMAALRQDPDRFRLLEPWRGTLAPLARLGCDEVFGRIDGCGVRPAPAHSVAAGARAERTRPGADAGPEAGGRVLVVALTQPGSREVADRIRWAVTLLGKELDESSALDRSRWLRLLTEAMRLPVRA